MLKKIWTWIVTSSADPEKWSATIKGLATLVPAIVVFLGIANIHVDPETLLGLIDKLGVWASAVATIIGATIAVLGFIRKLGRSTLGTNHSLDNL